MVDVFGYLPKIGFSKDLAFSAITWFIVFVLFVVLVGILAYFLVMWLKFNKKIVLFKKVGGQPRKIGRDKARVMKMGRGGDTIFYLRKHKKYLPTPQIETGAGEYWYWVREDGVWINIGMEDVDEKQRQVNAHFLDKEMRYARVALERNLRERYETRGFWEKYGGLVAYAGLIAITGIMAWLLFDKFLDISGQVATNLQVSNAVMEKAEQVLVSLDNICTGSGIRVA